MQMAPHSFACLPACCNHPCRWTNGLFKSTLHRVVNTAGKERYSCAFFFEPNFNTRVECLPCCVNEDRPAAYPPTTAGEHLLGKYAQTHAGYDVTRKQQQRWVGGC
jgi:isopenicillin N synthase-like dioxygenase